MSLQSPVRPASAGRLVLAMLVSAGLHTVFLVAATGSPLGGAMPSTGIDAVLQVKPFSSVQVSPPALGDLDANEIKTPVSALPPENLESHEDQLPAPAMEPMPLADQALIPIGDPSRYFLAHELDVRPQIMTRTEPDFPASALEKSVSAAVQTRLYIDEDGGGARRGTGRG